MRARSRNISNHSCKRAATGLSESGGSVGMRGSVAFGVQRFRRSAVQRFAFSGSRFAVLFFVAAGRSFVRRSVRRSPLRSSFFVLRSARGAPAMNLETLRKHCLAFPGATEQIQWGADLVFKVGGKMFCVAC